MSGRADLTILQVGFGGFGPVHARAWARLGLGDRLLIADPRAEARAAAQALPHPQAQIVADADTALDAVDAVDVVAPTDRHFEICARALQAGRDVFVEKPMTATLDEARRLAALAEAGGRVLQVGYYFRFHPLGAALKARLDDGAVGAVRTVAARFVGYKRARTDSGALANDAAHFIDLVCWLLDAGPERVYARTRDHFGRGMEDFVVLLLDYPGGVLARIEAGYVEPGRWRDDIVPDATATKELTVAGETGALEADFVQETLLVHEARHQLVDGIWRPRLGEVRRPALPSAGPVDVVAAELAAFVDAVARRARPGPDAQACGVRVAAVIEAALQSARENRPVRPAVA